MRSVIVALLGVLALNASVGHAKGFALQLFEPAPAGDRFTSANDASVSGHLTPSFVTEWSYGYRPLRLVDEYTDEETKGGALVRDQVYWHLGAALPVADRLLIDASFPVALYQTGNRPLSGFPKPSTTSFADIRVGARLNLFGGAWDPAAVALAFDTWIPAGRTKAYTTDGTWRFEPKLVSSGILRDSNFAWSFNLGYVARQGLNLGVAKVGSAITLAAAAGVLFDEGRLLVGPEFYGDTTLNFRTDGQSAQVRLFDGRTTPLELLLAAHWRFLGNLVVAAGIGPGLTTAPGSPTLRAVLSLAYTPEPIPPLLDRDGDGIGDAKDACPLLAGVASSDSARNGCPAVQEKACCKCLQDADGDGDGIPDAADACPKVKDVVSGDPQRHSCPVTDRDHDGIDDDKDACLDVPGVAADDPKRNGCPVPSDRDHDGVPDEQDACPDLPGVASPDPLKSGCPASADRDHDGVNDESDLCPDVAGRVEFQGCPSPATLTGDTIVISEQVHFEVGRVKIREDSFDLLASVADILRQHPEIVTLAIRGHTDSRGDRAKNVELSQRRAEAVQTWLSKQGGIAKDRLTAKGFGPDLPATSNDSETGRAANRRVEFVIEKRRDEPQRGNGGGTR